MSPGTGERVLRFVGDRLRFSLRTADGQPLPPDWRALLRTNLGRAQALRYEIIHSYPAKPPLAGAMWHDIPLLADGAEWSRELTLAETGFFRAKARSVQACCRQLVDLHGGEVPRTMEELTALAGVGRKTANVVLGNCFGVPGMVVDTHVLRLSKRWELTVEEDADKVESDLCDLLPRSEWTVFSHRVTWFGRSFCTARNPRCPECRLRDSCPFGLAGGT